MAKLTDEQMEKRRKINKKILIFFGVIFAIMVVIGIIGSLTGKDDEKTAGTKSEKAVTKNYALDPMLAEFKNDPVIQEWMEIKKRTTPFKKDKKWIKETFEYLLKQNQKWQVTKDKEIIKRIDAAYGNRPDIIKFKSDNDLYEKYLTQLDMLLQRFRDKIVKSFVCKNMVSFPIAFKEFDKLSTSSGFIALIKDEGLMCSPWPAWKYYVGYRTQDGKTKGKGRPFKAEVNQDGNIIDIDIPLGEKIFDYKSIGRDRVADDEMFKNFLKEHLSNPAEWISPSLNLIFGKDAQTVANKMTEIGKADDAKLKEMSGDNFTGFGLWFTSFSIGGKNITIRQITGTTTMSIKMDKTYKLQDIYEKIIRKKVL